MPHPYDSCLACDSFSTTISSVNFFGKSIPLPFFFVFFFQCKYFLFVLIWFTKGDPPPLDNIQVLMPNDYIVQLYHRHCYIAHSSWITQLHIKFLSKYFYEILCIPTACQAQLIWIIVCRLTKVWAMCSHFFFNNAGGVGGGVISHKSQL